MMKGRDVYLDNIKSVLILFVVFGHFTNLNRNDSLMAWINKVIYSFRMVLFILLQCFSLETLVVQGKLKQTKL